jgi:hypothetical protein
MADIAFHASRADVGCALEAQCLEEKLGKGSSTDLSAAQRKTLKSNCYYKVSLTQQADDAEDL